MGKLKFPYTMHCPACKAGLKISNPKQVGTMINCPKCKKKIEVVTPDEDAHVSYGVEETEEEEEPKKKKPSKKEVEAKRLEAEKEKRAKIMGNVSHVVSIIGTLAALAACIGVFYYFIFLKPPAESDDKKKKKAAIESRDAEPRKPEAQARERSPHDSILANRRTCSVDPFEFGRETAISPATSTRQY